MSLSDDLAKLVSELPPTAIDVLSREMDNGTVSLSTSSVGFAHLKGIGDDQAARIASAFESVSREYPEEVASELIVATALRVANRLRTMERLGRPDIEIAWTGPAASGPLVRKTHAILEEMLEGVRDAGEVLLVGYALSAKPGSAMVRVVDLLIQKARRGASISIVLHSDEDEETNLDNLLRLWNVFVTKPRVYTWRPPPDHPYTKLHAKCLVVDRLDVLVTSANFTFHGLESNLELGLRVRGPQAAAIAERFDHLIASKVLRPWTG